MFKNLGLRIPNRLNSRLLSRNFFRQKMQEGATLTEENVPLKDPGSALRNSTYPNMPVIRMDKKNGSQLVRKWCTDWTGQVV